MQIHLPQAYLQIVEEHYASLANPEIGPWPISIIKSVVALGNNDSVRGENRFVALASNVLRTLTETQRAEFIEKYNTSSAIISDESPWPEVLEVESWLGNVDEATVLYEARLDAIRKINSAAGVMRKTFITDIPGQEMLYMKKETEARAYLAAANPVLADYPLIEAEVGITADDAAGVAQVYAQLGDAWIVAAAALEKARLGAVVSVEQAETTGAVRFILETFLAGGEPELEEV